MEEIWKSIKDYEGIYEVSNLGRVKSLRRFREKTKGKPEQNILLKERILKAYPTGKGKNIYLTVRLSKNKIEKDYRVHQLMAVAFLNHKIDGYKNVVDHIDNNSLNNSLDNLQIISQRENSFKDTNKTSSKYPGVSKRGKKWVAQAQVNNKNHYLGIFDCEKEASIKYFEFIKECSIVKSKCKTYLLKKLHTTN